MTPTRPRTTPPAHWAEDVARQGLSALHRQQADAQQRDADAAELRTTAEAHGGAFREAVGAACTEAAAAFNQAMGRTVVRCFTDRAEAVSLWAPQGTLAITVCLEDPTLVIVAEAPGLVVRSRTPRGGETRSFAFTLEGGELRVAYGPRRLDPEEFARLVMEPWLQAIGAVAG
jgi:hypothetical protein